MNILIVQSDCLLNGPGVNLSFVLSQRRSCAENSSRYILKAFVSVVESQCISGPESFISEGLIYMSKLMFLGVVSYVA